MSKKSQKREAIVTLVWIIVIAGLLLGGFQLLRVYLNTDAPFRIISDQPSSMAPNMYYGDVGVIQNVPPYQIGIGDVIVFNAYNWYLYNYTIPPAPVMHRVIDVKFEDGQFWYKTWGDNRLTNPTPDPGWTPDWLVYGKVILTLPRIGLVSIWFNEGGYILVVVILAIFAVVYGIWESEKEVPLSDQSDKSD
ncbi:MAG: signal peptidase I [Candidatus Freyarchaeum deiterrae]